MSTPSRAISRERRLHRPSTKLTGHSTHIIAAEWSADSSRLVSAAWNDSTVRVWDVEAARTASKLEIAKGVNNVRLSPTGDRLAATFDDKVARVYALASGRELASARQGARTQALEMAPDGGVYWAGFGAGDDGVWAWSPGAELCRRLWPHELSKPPPWSRAHPVQVFVGGELVVEGHLGIGSGEDTLGVDNDPDGVGERVGEELSARKLLAGIEDLLALLPAD
jgi:hypothetical protein